MLFRSLSPPMAGWSVIPLVEVSHQLAQLQHLVPFPEEIAYILMEQELELYRRILPLDYLFFLTKDLSTTAGHPYQPSVQRPHPLYVSTSSSRFSSLASSHESQQCKTVKDLVSRFNEVRDYVLYSMMHCLVSDPLQCAFMKMFDLFPGFLVFVPQDIQIH